MLHPTRKRKAPSSGKKKAAKYALTVKDVPLFCATNEHSRKTKTTRQSNIARRLSFTSLPPEIRNKIYALTLVDDDSIHVRAREKGSSYPRLAVSHKTIPPWREPGILQVSKQCRQEATAMYYQSNDFILTLVLTEMSEAVDWIRSVMARCGDRPFLHFNFTFGVHDWTDLDCLRTWVDLYAQTNVQLIPGTKCSQDQNIHVNCHHRSPAARLEEVVDHARNLGERAKERDWAEGQVDVEFELWLEDRWEESYIKHCINQSKKRRKIAARRKAEEDE